MQNRVEITGLKLLSLEKACLQDHVWAYVCYLRFQEGSCHSQN